MFAATIAGGLERCSECCPAGHDIVAEHRSQRVAAHESCVQQMQIVADESNHRHERYVPRDMFAGRLATNGAAIAVREIRAPR